MLPTDELIQQVMKATGTTLTTQVTALIPQLWAARIEKNLRRRECLQSSVVVNSDLLVPNAGNTVYIPILPDLAQADALTEGVDMVMTQLTAATSVALTPTEFGKAVEASRAMLDQIKYDGMAEIIDRLSYAMSLRIEGNIAALYSASVPGTSNKLMSAYPAPGKGSGSITPADTLSDWQILNAISQLEQQNNVPFEDGFWRLYISPSQWSSLLQDSNIRNDIRWADARSMLLQGDNRITGERGSIHGCRIIVTNYINTATENSTTVYKALLVAPRWAAIAYKRRPEVVVDPTLYDFGRRRRFGITAGFDVELLHNERGVVLTSA